MLTVRSDTFLWARPRNGLKSCTTKSELYLSVLAQSASAELAIARVFCLIVFQTFGRKIRRFKRLWVSSASTTRYHLALLSLLSLYCALVCGRGVRAPVFVMQTCGNGEKSRNRDLLFTVSLDAVAP
eukprot:126824-Amphidinium_carterae.1